MRVESEELIPTRASLLARLKDWEDRASWQQFFDTYWKLIYGVARKGGLRPEEAQDVVQETLVAVAKQMPTFKYNPSGSFKAWLLNVTRWRITDQLRRRGTLEARMTEPAPNGAPSDKPDAVAMVADPAVRPIEEIWEEDWRANLVEAALANVRRRADPLKYQIFDCCTNQGWKPEKVAAAFGVSVAQVYLTKHRITKAIKEEVSRLERETT